MAPAPKRVDSVAVTNACEAAVTVSVVFDNHKEQIDLTEDHIIEAGATWVFEEKQLDMGSWQAVAPVKKITVSNANGFPYVLEPAVGGVVKQLKVTVQPDGKLKQTDP